MNQVLAIEKGAKDKTDKGGHGDLSEAGQGAAPVGHQPDVEVAVKFATNEDPVLARQALESVISKLSSRGILASGSVERVFPAELDPELASLFVVTLVPKAKLVSVSPVLRSLRRLTGVEYAHEGAMRAPA